MFMAEGQECHCVSVCGVGRLRKGEGGRGRGRGAGKEIGGVTVGLGMKVSLFVFWGFPRYYYVFLFFLVLSSGREMNIVLKKSIIIIDFSFFILFFSLNFFCFVLFAKYQ